MYFYAEVFNFDGQWFTVGDEMSSVEEAWAQFDEYAPDSAEDERRVVVYRSTRNKDGWFRRRKLTN